MCDIRLYVDDVVLAGCECVEVRCRLEISYDDPCTYLVRLLGQRETDAFSRELVVLDFDAVAPT